MKTIILSTFLMLSTLFTHAQETNSITQKAFFLGYDEDMGIYYFETIDSESVEVQNISEGASSKYDLKSDDLLNKMFLITYESTYAEDDNGYVYQKNTIINLEEIKNDNLEQQEEIEDSFDEEDSDE